MSAASNRAKKHYYKAANNFNRENNDSSLFKFLVKADRKPPDFNQGI